MTTTRPVEATTAAAPPRLGPLQYLGYAAGDAANNLAFSMTSMFLLVYYTDVAGISAAAAGTCSSSSASGTASRTSSPAGWSTGP